MTARKRHHNIRMVTHEDGGISYAVFNIFTQKAVVEGFETFDQACVKIDEIETSEN